ncbi:scarecrow-like transcription factor 11 (SCL11) [Thalictrum thalictroides]|uniref:Scarecrow-like transcription factor 11 (SCL11) n=1 Tax=Thalictrum thalictroides TaxID=46969 RepID=A0A7J6UVM3_THATH|nr:scarecrow-like transcription factor 11 (SCL11) [Thalictrum thalictroides]
MAKRELSSTLMNLKFMQRAVPKVVKPEKEEEEEAPKIQNRKCIVIMEGNPHPGAVKGRMSFQSFNPSIDKLNEVAENPCQPNVASTSSSDGKTPERENGSSCIGAEGSDHFRPESDTNEKHKRKHPDRANETQRSNKSPKNATVEGDQVSSPNKRNGCRKQRKREKLDWNILRQPQVQNRR